MRATLVRLVRTSSSKSSNGKRKHRIVDRQSKSLDALTTTNSNTTNLPTANEVGTFVDLLMLPTRSTIAIEREALLRSTPSDASQFWVSHARTLDNYMKLLKIQGVNGDAKGALHTWNELRKDGAKFQLHLIHYNHILAALARKGDCNNFDAIRKEMVEQGLGSGDAHTFSSAATCYMRAGDTKRALGAIREAKQAGVAPDEVLYGALLSGFARRGDIEGAEAVWMYLNTRSGPKPDSVLYTSMISACAKAGRAEKALMLLKRMQGDGLIPTEVTYNAVLHACARRLDMWTEAKSIFQSMKDSGIYISEYTMNTLLLCAARSGDVGSCSRIVADMRAQQMEVSLITLNTQLNGYARAFQHVTSQEKPALLKEAEAHYAQITTPDLRSDLARLNVYVEGMYMERAKEWFEHLKKAHPQAATLVPAWTAMIKLWSTGRRPEALQETLDAMEAAGVALDPVAYKWVIGGFARAFWIRSAVEWVGKMVDAGLRPERQHIHLIMQRCKQEDLRRHKHNLEQHLERWKSSADKRHRTRENELAQMMATLAGDELPSFLLPFPIEVEKEKRKKAMQDRQ